MRLPISVNLSDPDALTATSNAPFVLIDGQPVLIELQGEISSDADGGPSDLAGQKFGQLDMSNPVRWHL
jgi:hypothetical protein